MHDVTEDREGRLPEVIDDLLKVSVPLRLPVRAVKGDKAVAEGGRGAGADGGAVKVVHFEKTGGL